MRALKHRNRLPAAALLLLLIHPGRVSATATVPKTPAGRVLSAWLGAFNSGDRARVTAFVKRYQADNPHGVDVLIEHVLEVRRETGGFDLVSIERAEPLAMELIVNARSTPQTWLVNLEVTNEKSPRVVELHREEMRRGSKAPMRISVDAATRARVLDGVARTLSDWYVYPDVAKKMVELLRAHQGLGEYDGITDGRKLARAINDDLHSVNSDGHLSIECTPETVPADEADPPSLDSHRPIDERFRAEMLRDNCGVEKVDRLEGNVGYLKLDFFASAAVCAATASAAMNLLAHVDALIIDLRENGGGAPRMVAWLSSYLFDARTHLNDQYERRRNKTTEFWTDPNVPGAKLGGKPPVYVLVGKGTYSAAEEFAYDLKYLNRATIVGQNTGGGAHPTAPVRVDDHFVVHVPYARAINPITKQDWEGTGVAPTREVPVDQALEEAKKLAVEAIRANAPPPAP